MSRAKFQVLVLPFLMGSDGLPRYLLFRRTDSGYWQGIAGGGEDTETPIQAARREAHEEAGISLRSQLFPLSAMTTIPVVDVCGFLWGPEVMLVPEHSFAVLVESEDVVLSAEHLESRWCDYDQARSILKWDSNRTALWELNHRILNSRMPPQVD
jgi:dihydroneopterin triphosphate diphosphatase